MKVGLFLATTLTLECPAEFIPDGLVNWFEGAKSEARLLDGDQPSSRNESGSLPLSLWLDNPRQACFSAAQGQAEAFGHGIWHCAETKHLTTANFPIWCNHRSPSISVHHDQ